MLTPIHEAELATAIAAADGPLRIIGGGTRPLGNPVAGRTLSTAALSGITLYEPGALTIVAKAGTPLAEVEEALATEGQRFPFEPMDHRLLLGTSGEPTIGGMVAVNASGPRRIQAGACRDSVIGVRFVDGTGTIIKNGGRVMKNVTGYDLVKLLTGSHGTLGVLTELSFKVLPETAARATLKIRGLEVMQAVDALSRALTSPFEITGAAHATAEVEGDPLTMIRIEGFKDSVAYRSERLKSVLRNFGEIEVDNDEERVAADWKRVRDVEAFAERRGDVWRISVKPSDGPRLVEAIRPATCLLDWGGGLVWVLSEEGTDIRARMSGMPGHATIVRAAEATKRALDAFHPEATPLSTIAAELRRRFDPRGVFNRGLMSASEHVSA